MAQNDSHSIPAFGLHGLTRYYDSFAKLVNPLRHRLLQQANIQPGQRVLDLGCGTGLLTLMIKRSVPEAQRYLYCNQILFNSARRHFVPVKAVSRQYAFDIYRKS